MANNNSQKIVAIVLIVVAAILVVGVLAMWMMPAMMGGMMSGGMMGGGMMCHCYWPQSWWCSQSCYFAAAREAETNNDEDNRVCPCRRVSLRSF